MEKGSASEHQGLLLAELARLQDLARQIEAELNQHSTNECCQSLFQELFSSIEKVIRMAKSSKPDGEPRSSAHPNADGDSPLSPGESLRSETSKLAFKDQMSKKRKTLSKWTSEVRVGSGAGGVEGPVDDNYSWRKYGQKDILGAKYPRGYYRCTHRMTQGCPATKQVQRSDKDPLLFHVTYHGNHTCLQRHRQKEPKHQQQQNQDLLLSFQTGHTVATEGLDLEAQARTSLSFSFGSKLEAAALNDNIFSSPSTPDNCFNSRTSPTFLSPTASELTYFSLSPHEFEGEIKLWSPESDATEIISGANSATNSTAVGMGFVLQGLDFEQDFSSFFS